MFYYINYSHKVTGRTCTFFTRVTGEVSPNYTTTSYKNRLSKGKLFYECCTSRMCVFLFREDRSRTYFSYLKYEVTHKSPPCFMMWMREVVGKSDRFTVWYEVTLFCATHLKNKYIKDQQGEEID